MEKTFSPMTVGAVLMHKAGRGGGGGSKTVKLKWLGGHTCDLCGRKVADQGPEFYDAPVVGDGRWALICYKCRHRCGKMGQVYDSADFTKICNIQHRR